MAEQLPYQVFLSYSEANQDLVDALARRLRGDARLSFWFAPWHAIPGRPIQEQTEDALTQSESCAIFIGGGSDRIAGFQNREMREAIRRQVEENPDYRVIPVFLPGAERVERRQLPPFLRHYYRTGMEVAFRSLDDEPAFKRLLAGILNVPPIQIEGYLQAVSDRVRLRPPAAVFEQGHALVIGVATYVRATPLPESVLNDARDLGQLLTDPTACGYPEANVIRLLDGQATGAGIRAALATLARRTGPDDTTIVFFSGHGAHNRAGDGGGQYLLPHDCDAADLPGTAIVGDEMTALLQDIAADRLLVLFDSCHSGGAGDPKGPLPQFERGLEEAYYEALAQGNGRVVMASSRSDELSWTLPGMRNSLFTHYLLEALRGQARTLGDGYVRVFDVFRHVAGRVPARAKQHPVFKATALEEDFPIAIAG